MAIKPHFLIFYIMARPCQTHKSSIRTVGSMLLSLPIESSPVPVPKSKGKRYPFEVPSMSSAFMAVAIDVCRIRDMSNIESWKTITFIIWGFFYKTHFSQLSNLVKIVVQSTTEQEKKSDEKRKTHVETFLVLIISGEILNALFL